jgi:hypothetical protein
MKNNIEVFNIYSYLLNTSSGSVTEQQVVQVQKNKNVKQKEKKQY